MRAKKYDANGNYSEEYQRIKLIKYFLVEGYRQIFIEHVIKILIGHKGRNSLILKLDLLIKKNNQPFIVAEVKKKYTKRGMISAIEHQLKPAMANTWTKYGIYFDGTEKSHFLIRNEDGTFTSQRFLLTRSFKNYIKKNNSKL